MCDTAEFVGSLNVSRLVARLRVERDHTTRSSLHRLLLEEANNLAFNLGRLGSWQREGIEGRAPIAIQIGVVETLAANGQDAKLAKSMLSNLIEVQRVIEQYRRAIVHVHGPKSPPTHCCKHAARRDSAAKLEGIKGYTGLGMLSLNEM
jgi:hypothetical protein